ncbi:ricin B lectin domain-containing protein, partial [Mycena pura]
YIHPSANAAKCITAASNVNGAAVEIEDCIAAGSASQSWTVSGSALQIFWDKCLDVTGGATADGTKMQIWTCNTNNANQKWTLSGSTIHWSGHSNCLDLTDGRVTNGNIIQIWTCTGGNNQKWALTTGPGSGTPPVGNAIKPGASSTTCLTAPSNTDGGAVVVQPCNGASSQSWTRNGGTYVIYGNKCLDVTNGSTANGVKMQIWSCNTGSTNQQFTTTSAHAIQWTGKGKCLDLADGSLTSGNKIQMWACSAGNTNQVWDIV